MGWEARGPRPAPRYWLLGHVVPRGKIHGVAYGHAARGDAVIKYSDRINSLIVIPAFAGMTPRASTIVQIEKYLLRPLENAEIAVLVAS